MTIYRDETEHTPAVNDRICVDLGDRSYEVVVQDGCSIVSGSCSCRLS